MRSEADRNIAGNEPNSGIGTKPLSVQATLYGYMYPLRLSNRLLKLFWRQNGVPQNSECPSFIHKSLLDKCSHYCSLYRIAAVSQQKATVLVVLRLNELSKPNMK